MLEIAIDPANGFVTDTEVGEYFDEFNPNQNAVIIPTYIYK